MKTTDAEAAPRREYWLVLVFALVALWIVFAFYTHLCLTQTEGKSTSTTDDAFITMTVARNLALNGTWGIEPGHFASLVSSPAWVLLMAAIYRVVGPAQWVPLAMNIFWASALFVLIWAVCRSFRVRPVAILLGLLLVMFATPMVPVAFTGLEHMLQCCVDLAFVFAAGLALGEDAPPSRRRTALLAMLWLAPCLTLVRYEGVFIIATAVCILLVRRKIKLALLTGALGMAPVVVSGLIFISKGWFFFPTTLMQKGNYPTFHTPGQYLTRLAEAIFMNLHATDVLQGTGAHLAILIGLVLLAWLALRLPLFSSQLGIMTALFMGMAFMHLELARLGWFYRYEAYIVCIGLVLLLVLTAHLPWQSLLLPANWPDSVRVLPLVLAAALVLEPLLDRACRAYVDTPIAARNVWEQQYQMAQFLHTYYEGASVVANDIGAINYFATIHCLDYMGLANSEVLRLTMKNQYNAAALQDLARKNAVRIGVVYESWLNYFVGIPPDWAKAGEWMILDNVVCGSPRVAFFAVDPRELPALRKHLQEFSTRLPNSVNASLTR